MDASDDLRSKAEEIKGKIEEKVDKVGEKASEVADKVHDKLHDAKGKMRQHELFRKAVKKAFKQCDFDDNGKIDGAELYTGILLVWDKVNKLCPVHIKVPKKAEVKTLMKKHDMDESGTLTEEEFTMVVDDLVAGSTGSWHKSIWFRVLSSVALKLAIFPAAGHGLKKGLDAAGFEAINKVPTAVLAMMCEITYKVANMQLAEASSD